MKFTIKPKPRAGEPLSGHVFRWLIPALIVVFLPHLRNVPLWLTALFLGTVVWRWRGSKNWRPPNWKHLTLLTLLAGCGVAVQYGTILGRDAGVALLVAMLALKVLESRYVRDGVVLLMLGYFLVLSNLLYTQSMLTILYVLLSVSTLVFAQIYLPRQNAALPSRLALLLCGRILLQSIPVMLVLFVLFPRIPGPLWGLPKDSHSGLTGLSDEMTPGDIGQLILSDKVAFRVRFNGPLPSPDLMYWRGPVLTRFDGRSWKMMPELRHNRLNYTFGSRSLSYSVVLEPHGQRWLYALEMPGTIPEGAGMTRSLQIMRRKSVTEVIRYDLISYTQYRTGDLSYGMRRLALQLPRDGNPKARALAAEIFNDNPEPAERVRAVLKLFREEPFRYTLSPPVLGRDSMDEFLFDTREGFCEHYASAFVFLMRAAQVPARVVTGYQGGESNDMGGYFMVRQSDAHAWAEVWLEGSGWVRVDPTAAVAPERVEQGLYAAVEEAGSLPLLARRDSPWLRELAMRWDLVNNAWNEWILSYGPERQREFLSRLGLRNVHWSRLLLPMMISLGILAAVYLLFHMLRSGQQMKQMLDPVAMAYQRFCKKLARHGLIRKSHEGPLDFSRRAAGRFPGQAEVILEIGSRYANLRFGPSLAADEQRSFEALVQSLRVRSVDAQDSPKS